MDVSKELQEIINVLSENLSVPAEQVFQVMIRQANVFCITWLIGLVFTVILCGVFYIALKKFVNLSGEENEALPWVMVMITGIATLFSIVFLCVTSYHALTAWMNPEFWVLKEITKML